MRLFTLLLIGCVSVQATAADINVPGVNGPTIQAAINASVNGDEIIVAQGTYPEAIDFLGKAITVRSTDPTDPVVVMQPTSTSTGSGILRLRQRHQQPLRPPRLGHLPDVHDFRGQVADALHALSALVQLRC